MAMHPSLELRQSRTLAMTSDLRRAIGFLRCTNREIAAEAGLLARTNPHLGLGRVPLPVGIWPTQERPDAGRAPPGTAPGVPSRPGPVVHEAETPAPSPGLLDHVLSHLNLLVRDPAERPVALALAAALDPSGWLTTPLSEIAQDCGTSEAEVEAVLARLQQIEPAGLFARSLPECLRLQAQDRDLLDPAFECLLGNLPLLASGNLSAVAARCGCDVARVQAMLRTLRTMDPKPGARFDTGPSPVREPDLLVWENRGEWMVALNRSTLPALHVIEKPGDTASEDALRAARGIERAVSRRNDTTLRIARAVVGGQPGFVTGGAAQLRPLSLADVAAGTGFHVSTISRVTAGLLVSLPRGTVRFRDFFSAGLGEAGAEVALGAVLHEMHRLIRAEPPGRPLSDQDIADHFGAQGLALARRTIAKYRATLRIPGSAERRAADRLRAGS